LAGVFIIVFILYRNYRQKVKTNKILDKQKEEIESLLLNILPAEVAKELQQRGYATSRYYETVTVLFTDFKSFTKLAEGLSPNELVAELNDYFMAFDLIIDRYKLEKIKTIGDAYMCAGGVPLENAAQALSAVGAGLEIQEYVRTRNVSRMEMGLPPWELRVGIHTGAVVAGVVGIKKYAYDIWGDTVNIASRMESSGEVGKVNISGTTYELVKDQFSCTYRGKIDAKNKGQIDMYFVQGRTSTGKGAYLSPSAPASEVPAA
jgi:class 3 adenylate cyclase